MNLRTYRAYTLQQALDAVREDLGPGAVILRTSTARRGGFMGLGTQTIVEVTASDGPPPPSFRLPAGAEAPARPRPSRPAPADERISSPSGRTGESEERHEPVVFRDDVPPKGTTPAPEPRAAGERPPSREDRPRPERRSRGPELAPPPPVLDLEVERRKTKELARRLLARHEAAAKRPPESVVAAAAEPESTPSTHSAPSAHAVPAAAPRPEVGRPQGDSPGVADVPDVPGVPAPAAAPRVATSRPISVPPPRETEEPPPPTVAGPRPPRADMAPRPVLRQVDGASAAAPDPAAEDVSERAEAAMPEIFVRGADGPASSDSSDGHGRVARPAARARDEELDAIRGLVGDVLRDAAERRREPLSPLLFSRHLTLRGQELSEEAADAVCEAAREDLTAAEWEQPEAVDACIVRHLAARIPIAAESLLARSPDGRPLTVAFVGPTGVGKTTTVAKLAAALRLRHGRSVGLITADTYRIAAVEQLRTYADIIGVPLRVATEPAEMRAATLEMADRDVILIDTAGRSQRDVGRINDLRCFVDAADPHEVHMVLSGIAGHRALLREAQAFGAIGVHKLVLTKLDEAVSYGMLIDAVAEIGIPLSFLTTGQEVPDDLERANAERLARLALDVASESTTPAEHATPRADAGGPRGDG